MALSASPPPQLPSVANDMLIEQLDEDIVRVRAEIATLTQRRSLLAASLLSSTKIQAHLKSYPQEGGDSIIQLTSAGPSDTSTNTNIESTKNPLTVLKEHSRHNTDNIHRLAFGVTSFPFIDPNPDTSDEALLGIRFDIPSHNGKFEQAPYYLFCKRVDEHNSSATNGKFTPSNRPLTIHHHTIPAWVALQDSVDKYLSLPSSLTISSSDSLENDTAQDEGYDSPSPSQSRASSLSPPPPTTREHDPSSNMDMNPKSKSNTSSPKAPQQNLHALVSEIYAALLAHSKRKAIIRMLSSVPESSSSSSSFMSRDIHLRLHPSLSSLSATGEDCRFIRLIWHDGLVGRVKISDDGYVERTVVFGEEGRLRNAERMLSVDSSGDPLQIAHLGRRLEDVAKKRGTATIVPRPAVAHSEDRSMINVNEDDADFEIE